MIRFKGKCTFSHRCCAGVFACKLDLRQMFIFPSQSSGFSWWWWRLFDRVSSILRWCQPPLILIKLFRIFRDCANLIYFEVTNMPFWNPMYLHNEYLNRNKFMVHNPFNWGIFVACLSSFIAQLFIKRTTAVLRRSWKEFPCFLVEISSCADDRRKNIFHSSQLRMAHSNNFQGNVWENCSVIKIIIIRVQFIQDYTLKSMRPCASCCLSNFKWCNAIFSMKPLNVEWRIDYMNVT